jgi:uncharacterized protein YlxP (DUF503 family)
MITDTPSPRASGIARGSAWTSAGCASGHNQGVWTGTLELDLLLGDVHSLKEKRSVVRPLVAELRRRFEVSAAEVDHLDLHRRAGIGVGLVAADRAHVVEVLDAAERLAAYRPEVELLSARRRLVSSDDE